MNAGALITIVVFFTIVSLSAFFSIRLGWHEEKQRRKKQAQAAKLALQLHPTYRQKLAEDREYELKKERQTVELSILQARFQLEHYTTLTRVPPETYLIGEIPPSITPLPSLRTRVSEKEPPPGCVLEHRSFQPSHEELVSIIKPNSYTYCPGINAQTGDPVIVDFIKVPHLKIIGTTGFGKSCLCGSIIDQLTTTHDPRRLQITLLDLEHKTSRLYEELPRVATIPVNNGKREVRLVATSADQVAEYLGYLYQHMKYREQLLPEQLYKLPVMLIYIEELLALTQEVVDQRLLNTIFHSLLLLAVRARKYGMFLLAAMQLDYSTEHMKVNQKMFRFRGAAGVDPTAARAAGFINTELIKQNFQHGKPGQFVVEFPGFRQIVLSPVYDVEAKLAEKFGYTPDFGQYELSQTPPEISALKGNRNTPETPLKNDETAKEARFQEIRELREKGWGKVKIIEKVWHAKPGKSKAYLAAEQEYEQFLMAIEQQEQIGA